MTVMGIAVDSRDKDRRAFGIDIGRFIWDRKADFCRIPFAYRLYKLLMRLRFRDGTVVIIPRGPAAGCKWRHSQAYQAWMAMGIYELEAAQFICDQLNPGDVFYDIGANAGYFTLVGARAVGPQGRVVAFDPVPQNVRTIQEQIDLNGLGSYCRVEPFAVLERSGPAGFILTEQIARSRFEQIHLSELAGRGEERIEVEGLALDAYVKQHPPPTLVKMDIEGAEVLALRGAAELLRDSNRPRFVVSTHGLELEQQVKDIFRSAGYAVSNLAGLPEMVYALPGQKA